MAKRPTYRCYKWNGANKIGSDAAQSSFLAQISEGFMAAATKTAHIIHDQNYWITKACIGGRVFVADSLQRPLSAYVVRQLKHAHAACLDINDELLVNMVHCQIETAQRVWL